MADRAPEPRVIARSDPDYPRALEDLSDPPERVHVAGGLCGWPRMVAIVGSRAATPYGCQVASALARDLAALGIGVVSGLARGIDAAAHRGALEADGVTVAVLAGGLDSVSPLHHRDLAREVARRGALLTETPAGPPRPGMFLARNRLIAALAEAVVVVEAAERSGALSTAAHARRLGRALLAVPGDIDRATSRGCHALLRGGAALCAGADDVWRALPRERPASDAAGRVLAALGPEPREPGWLAERASVPLPETLAILLRLEWASVALRRPGQRWCRNAGVTP